MEYSLVNVLKVYYLVFKVNCNVLGCNWLVIFLVLLVLFSDVMVKELFNDFLENVIEGVEVIF